MRTTQIKCPVCGGPVNNMWFSHRVGSYAFFIVECWSGDLNKKSHHHLFEVQVKLDKVVKDYDEQLLQILHDIETEVMATSGISLLQAYVSSKLNEAKEILES